jgi:hypothetical protein
MVGIFSCVFWPFGFLPFKKFCLVQLPIFIGSLIWGEFSFLSIEWAKNSFKGKISKTNAKLRNL